MIDCARQNNKRRSLHLYIESARRQSCKCRLTQVRRFSDSESAGSSAFRDVIFQTNAQLSEFWSTSSRFIYRNVLSKFDCVLYVNQNSKIIMNRFLLLGKAFETYGDVG